MELINRIRKSRKGFTLVEIIVVLVILAIIAAFTIPAMLGFVDDANKKAQVAQARECYVAAQAISTEMLAGKSGTALATAKTNAVADIKDKATGRMADYIGTDVAGAVTAVTIDDNGKVSNLVYTGTNGYTITFNGDGTLTIS